MAKKQTVQNLTNNGTIKWVTTGRRDTYFVVGTWGGGSIDIQSTPNDGTNTIDEETGNTADFNWSPNANIPGGIELYFVLTGATSPDLDFYHYSG